MNRAKKQSTPGSRALQEILACRVCLATTGKMFCLETCGLNEAFFDITGIPVSPGDSMPQHVCYICCGLLQKAIKFRNKSRSTQSLLSNIPLTLDLMQQINSMHGHHLIRTNATYVNISEEKIELNDDELEDDLNDTETALCDNKYSSNDDKNYFNVKENYSNKEFDNDLNKFLNFNESIDELTILVNLSDNEDSKDDLTPVLAQQSGLKIKNMKVINKNKSTPNIDLTDSDKIRSIINSPYFEQYKHIFYKYIEAKYINETWNDESVKDEDKPLSELIIKLENNIGANLDPKVNKFYAFLRNRYGYIDAEREAVAKRPILDSVAKKTDKEVLEPKYRQIYADKIAMEFGNKYNFNVVTFSREEQIKNVRERMETDRYRDAKYKCEDCYTGFQFKHKYAKHRAKHDPAISGDFECDACKFRFPSRKFLFVHVRNCHKNRYICKECERGFRSRNHALDHYRSHKGSAAYQCKYCPAVFRWASGFYDHTREHHGTVFCDICHAVLTPSGLSTHMKHQHIKTFKCQSCEKVFNDSTALEKHLKTSPKNVCNPNDWPCTKCGENFTSESVLKEHIFPNPGRKKGTIARCETSESKSTLENRKKNVYRFMCELCGRTFSLACQLRDHMRIHTGYKPFMCSTCPKSFRLKMQLDIHTRTHTGEKPYKCPDCQKGFASLNNVRRHHFYVHLNIRRFTCDICDKAFQDKSGVNVHIRTVHMKIPMPPRIRNKKRKIENPGEERKIMSPKKRKRVVDTNEDERLNACEEDSEGRTSDRKVAVKMKERRIVSPKARKKDSEGEIEEAVKIEDDVENVEVEFIEEWSDD